MQPVPRSSVNLPVTSVKTLVDLLVKLAKSGRSIFDDSRPWSSRRPSPGVLVEPLPTVYSQWPPAGRVEPLRASLSPLYRGPITRPILIDLYRFLPIFRTFLGDYSSHSRVLFAWLLVYMTTVFFSEIVLWRNYLINRVVLFEEKSIPVFPECLEAC